MKPAATTRAEGLTGKDRVKVPELLLRGLVKPSRSPQEIARRAFLRGMVFGLKQKRGGDDGE